MDPKPPTNRKRKGTVSGTLATDGNEDIGSLVSALVPAVTEGVVTALRSMGVILPAITDSGTPRQTPRQTADSSTQVPPKDNPDVSRYMEKYYLRFQNKKILELEGCHADPSRVYTNPEEEVEKGNAIKATDLPTNTKEEEICYSTYPPKAPLLFTDKPNNDKKVCLNGQKVRKEADEKSPSSLCTIQVSGMKETTSKDTLEFYFHNKKSGGGGVKKVNGEVEDGFLLITFENEKTVEKVLQRKHKVDGVVLTVKQHHPRKSIPKCPNRILVKGLNPEISEEGLINYLEVKSGESVKDTTYGQEDGTVLVTFEELKDFIKLETACKNKPLHKSNLTLERVPISNCLFVSGLLNGTSRSTLRSYFENEERSGGGTVTCVKVHHSECTGLVYFEDYTVCDRVCSRSHSIDRQTFTVQIYYECLGQPLNHEDKLYFKCPSPLVLTEVNLMKMTFIYKSVEFKTALDEQAEMAHGKIKWPQKDATQLIVECTLTKDVKNCKSLAKTWKTNIKDDFMRMLDNLCVKEIKVKQTVWQGVLELINEFVISDSQRVIIVLEEARCTVVIVGYENNVAPLRDKIMQMISKLDEEIQRKKNWVKKSKTLKNHECLLLTLYKFKERTEQNILGVKVIINQIDRKIVIEGKNEDVAQATILLLEECNKICEVSGMMFSQYKTNFLSRKEVKVRVSQMLKDTKKSCFELRGFEVSLFAFSDEKAVEAAHLLKDEIVEYSFEVFPESAYLLGSEIWDKQAKHFESMEYFERLLQLITLIDQQKVIFITFSSLIGPAKKVVEDFFLANMIISDSKNISSGVFEYLEHHHSNKCQEISETLKDQKVHITKKENKYFIGGTKTGVAQAMNYIDEMILNVVAKKHTLKKPGILKYLKSDKGINALKMVQSENNCYIQIGEGETEFHLSSTNKGMMKDSKTENNNNLKGNASTNVLNVNQLHQDGLPGFLVDKEGNGEHRARGYCLGPAFAENQNDASLADIVVFGDCYQAVEAGIQQLDNLLDRDFVKKEIKEKIIQQLSKSQIKAIDDLKGRFDVDLTIDTSRCTISLYGTKDEISKASDEYHMIILEALRGQQDKHREKCISDYIQWYFVDESNDSKECIEYPSNINRIIEEAYRNQEKEVKFMNDCGAEYVINFQNMNTFPSGHKTNMTAVARKHKDFTVELPNEWSIMKNSDNLVVVQLKATDSEYSSVNGRFQEDVGKREIVKMERIQNKMLYQQYIAKKKLLESQNPKGTQNERELWHGTAPEAVSSINSLGLNRSYCGKNATAYGEGVCFAVNASYAASDTYSRPDGQRHKRMYLCKVLTVEYTMGNGGMRVPPPKQEQQSHILFDSVVNNVGDPMLFVIFNDTQCYPAYLITFK